MEEQTITTSAAIEAFAEYMGLLQKHSKRFPPTIPDIQHSSLLRRLLAGKKALPKPPPLAFSYPNYELAETGRDTPHEAKEFDGRVVIDQSEWTLVSKTPSTEFPAMHDYVVTWADQPEQYLLHWVKDGHEVTTCEGTPGLWRKEKRNGWVLERVNES